MTRRKPPNPSPTPGDVSPPPAPTPLESVGVLRLQADTDRPVILGPAVVSQIREALAAMDLAQERYALGTAPWGDVREYSMRLASLLRAVMIPGYSSYEPRWNEPDPATEASAPSADPEKQEPDP